MENVQPDPNHFIVDRCEEMLAMVALLDGSRQRALQENCRLRTTQTELESLVDASRTRERSNLDALNDLHKKTESLYTRYREFKETAKKETADLKAAVENLTKQVKALEAEKASLTRQVATSSCTAQTMKAEAERLRKQNSQLVDEDEAMRLKLRLRQLESENVELVSEKNKLAVQLQEAQADALMTARNVKTPQQSKSREKELEAKLKETQEELATLTAQSTKYKKWMIQLLETQEKNRNANAV